MHFTSAFLTMIFWAITLGAPAVEQGTSKAIGRSPPGPSNCGRVFFENNDWQDLIWDKCASFRRNTQANVRNFVLGPCHCNFYCANKNGKCPKAQQDHQDTGPFNGRREPHSSLRDWRSYECKRN
ncbi:hypothetical protein BS50DRAFT_582866 [Corynespora cassiicola Philippines]|uniref:Secreted protein n=1 Tax=Corynespora cassiicola Philippines TaxID=1448308 RepID=A0A2T2P6T4_CORCC|nr:hypothetical protein BS50DRAFT_582866 [Corynespora cassiicola Philippines]